MQLPVLPVDIKDLNYSGLRVFHVFDQFHHLGGVEAVLKHHFDCDRLLGIESDFLIFKERRENSKPGIHCFDCTETDSFLTIRKKVQAITGNRRNRILLYHTPWPLPFFVQHDYAERRIFIIHTDYPELSRTLKKYHSYLDGIICVNQEMRPKVESCVPWSENSRIHVVGTPISPPVPSLKRGLSRPIRLGYAGRLIEKQKRVDRLPGFCKALESLGIDYSLEILGDGSKLDFKRDNLNPKRCSLHGIKTGEDYWSFIRRWDFILFFNDFEGTPISLLEALSQGVLPLYPEIQTGGDKYTRQVLPSLLYSPGDIEVAAQRI